MVNPISTLPSIVQGTLRGLDDAEIWSYYTMQQRMGFQAKEPYCKAYVHCESDSLGSAIIEQRKMIESCNKETGFIIWLESMTEDDNIKNIFAYPFDPEDKKMIADSEVIYKYALKLLNDNLT